MLLLLSGLPSKAQTTIFDFGASWKYLDDGTDKGTAWYATTYAAEAFWRIGPAKFGYGDAATTCVQSGCTTGTICAPSCATKYITYYFRKTINIPSPAAYDSIRLSLVRDDGAIIYLNGVEIWRENMPTGTTDFSTWSVATIDGADETTPVVKSFRSSLFVAGNNTLAVEMHQRGPTSSDLGFDLKMEGTRISPPFVSLTRGPYLQIGCDTSVNVRWRTDPASPSRLQIGAAAGTYTMTVTDTAKTKEHELHAGGLLPDTKYYYRFGTDTSFLQGDTNNFFVTAPADTVSRKITVAIFGDCGRNDNGFQTKSLAAYQNYLRLNGAKASDLMLLLGDNAYDSGTDAEFTTGFFNTYSSNVLRNHMLFPTPGNHDYANNSGRQADHSVPYYNIFSMPTKAEAGGVPSGNKAYYSFNWGGIHFLSLDSYGLEDTGKTRMYDTSGAQVTWIKKDLEANTRKWVIAYWHHPPYTMGSHTSDGETELVRIRENFISILERYGVDMIICGHSHDYERSYLLKNYTGNEAAFNISAHTADSSSGKYNGTANSCPYVTRSGKYNHGTVYVVSGSSGADGGVQPGYPHNALPFSQDDGGMLYLEIQNNRLDARWIRRDSVIADQFTIMKDIITADTLTVDEADTVSVKASWIGAYNWKGGSTERTYTFTATKDTTITVKDSLTGTCLSTSFVIYVIPKEDTTTDTTTAIVQLPAAANEGKIYPVPAQDMLHLELDQVLPGNYEFTVYDLHGRILQAETRALSGRQRIDIDIRQLPQQQAMFLQVSHNGTRKRFRFIRS